MPTPPPFTPPNLILKALQALRSGGPEAQAKAVDWLRRIAGLLP